MGFYSDVKPGEPFRPSASLSNDVRHLLNQLNGFGGGVNPAAAPGIVRIPVYNSTQAVLSEGKAVSIDISGIIAGECYPAIAFSDEMPCYGVLAKDLNPAEVGDCILSGLAVVQISSTPATGNYATLGTGGVFVRGDEGVPIVNVSSTAAVVMLGAVKASSGGVIYEAGPGVNSDLLSGGTISGNYVGVGSVTVTPVEGSTNGQMKIACSGGGGGGSVPPGTIIAYAGPLSSDDMMFPAGYSGNGDTPAGWLHCNGQAVSRSEYADLFAAIGTVYGEGDGSNTFNVPDFRGSFLRGAGHPAAYDIMGVEVVEGEEEGEYVEAGIIEINGYEIDSGEAVISGQTVNIAGATVTTTGLLLNGTTYDYSTISISGNVLEVAGAYISDFLPLDDVSGEGQEDMGKYLHEQMPNIAGSFYGLAVNGSTACPHSSGHHWYSPPGPFRGATGVDTNTVGVVKFPLDQNSSVAPYTTGVSITADDPYSGSTTWHNVHILGEQNGSGVFVTSTGVDAVVIQFSDYYGQRIDNWNMTVNAYIEEYGSKPPENMLTVPDLPGAGHVLPQRHLVHWLIKY